jgi:hypothetical protein
VALVAAGLRDDQPQVRIDHPLLGREVAALDPLGEFDLLRGVQQRVLAGTAQEQVQRIGGPDRQLLGSVLGACRGVGGPARLAPVAARRGAPARRPLACKFS